MERLRVARGHVHGAAVTTDRNIRGVLFIDLDGTLVGAGGVHERVWAPLEALRRSGWRLSICTGRPGRGTAMELARRLDPEGLHVFESGSVVLDTRGQIVAARTLTPSTVESVAAFGARHGVTVEAYSQDGRFLVETRADPLIEAHEGLLGLSSEVSTWPPRAPLVRMQWNLPSPRWAELSELARPVTATLSAHEGRSPRMPGISFVSLTPAGVSKATGVSVVLTAYGVSPAQAAMAGDNLNDLEALSLVGRRYVPVDGMAEARRLADVLIASPDDGGVAEAALDLLDARG